MNSIEGILRKTMFHQPSKFSKAGLPFFIGSLHNGMVVKGEMRKPVEGERYRFYGEVRQDRKNPDREAFEFDSHEVLIDESEDGVAHYLATHIGGVGKVKAAAIVNHFGKETLHILRTTPERAGEVPNINPEIVESITRNFREECTVDPAAYAKLVEMFADLRFPRKLVVKLLDDWGSDAPQKVTEHPYMLLAYPRMSWEAVDSFATTRMKYDPAGIDRHKAAILEGMARINAEGHTVAGTVDIQAATFGLIGITPKVEAWAALIAEVSIVDVQYDDFEKMNAGSLWALPKIDVAEREIARRLMMLAEAAKPLAHPIDTEGLNEDQIRAVRLLEENGVAILTGLPGVGKSFVLAQFIKSSFKSKSFRSIRVVAPTGQASKVFAELIGDLSEQIPCTTIHRALAPTPSDEGEGTPEASARKGRGRDEFSFGRDEWNPLECDLIICDESSMVDVSLASSLLQSIPLGCRVVFVGDPKQLASVGPGAFLRDMIYAGIPCATLTQIVRSDSCGRIVKAIHAIDRGEMPEAAESFNLDIGDNYIHIEESKPVEIANIIVELHEQIKRGSKLGLSPTRDMQVVSAQKAKPFGCHNLNELLSKLLNPSIVASQDEVVVSTSDDESFLPTFRKIDKVIRKKNGLVDEMIEFDEDNDTSESGRPDWTWNDTSWFFQETQVVNGDIGDVLDIVPHDRGIWVVVKFRYPERTCRISIGECHLELAYASTCHSVQGSGFTYVIVPVHSSFYWDYKNNTGLWCREMLKTEMSRAKMLLATVGERSSMKLAISRETVDKRRTMLAERIRTARQKREEAKAKVEVKVEIEDNNNGNVSVKDIPSIQRGMNSIPPLGSIDTSQYPWMTTKISDIGIHTLEEWAKETRDNLMGDHLFPPLSGWKAKLAIWPIDSREAWGRRANELEEGGMPWDEAERRAFEEVSGDSIIDE